MQLAAAEIKKKFKEQIIYPDGLGDPIAFDSEKHFDIEIIFAMDFQILFLLLHIDEFIGSS